MQEGSQEKVWEITYGDEAVVGAVNLHEVRLQQVLNSFCSLLAAIRLHHLTYKHTPACRSTRVSNTYHVVE